MPHIVLTPEQSRVLAEAGGTVEVRDAQGQVVSYLKRFTPDELEAILRHSARKGSTTPGIPSARVQAMLQKAHEIDDREGMTPEKMGELLRRTRAGQDL
jgi:hypothetical protein